ncbi:MAG: hypothetical protein U1E05_05785 [Patescibacteria group bacterium]|nr:hypothetical protein [Patescibacteria group bacterium]
MSLSSAVVASGAYHVAVNRPREKTREVLRIMKPGGGYVGGASHDTIMGDTPVRNVLAMFDTLRAEGAYG